MQEEERLTKKTVTWLHLIITVVTVVAIGCKIQFDVNANRESIQELKDNQSKNIENVAEIKIYTAVGNVRLESVEKTVEKIDKKIDALKNNEK